jgi:hypothetical protein
MTVSEPCWAERNSDSMRFSSRPASVAASSSFSRDATCSSNSALATYTESCNFTTDTQYTNSLCNERDFLESLYTKISSTNMRFPLPPSLLNFFLKIW